MNQERSQPRYPSENREVRRPRQDYESERYQRGNGERYEDGRQSSPRYGDQREYSYGDDFGSERSYGSRYGSQRGGNDDWERDRNAGTYQSYQSYDEDRGGQRESSGPRYSYGAPGQGYGQSQGGSWGGSFGGSQGSYGSSGQGYGGRSYYGGRGQGQGQTQYGGGQSQYGGGQSSSYRGGDGGSWGSSQRENFGDSGSQQSRWSDGEGSSSYYGGTYRRTSQPYSYQGGSGMLISESATLYGPYTGKGPKNYKRSDQAITEEANQALERHGEVDASEIEVTCNNGVIKLTGKVENRRAKREAEECVERVYGVTDVMNELKVDKGFFANLFGSEAGKSTGSTSNDTSDDKTSSRTSSGKSFQKNT